MTSIAIIGAGPGLGAATARRFGREAFSVALRGTIGGGDPLFEPDALAERLWNIHAEHGPFRTTVTA
ncbi:hypothetical protein [Nocardia gamkensis]|uniref:hypothetical protein n=1 Tax=Nocardia gamkensis TaxID=352869 RepID=UPI0037CC6145